MATNYYVTRLTSPPPPKTRPRASTYCNRPLPPLPSPAEEASRRKRPRRTFKTSSKHRLSHFPTPPPLLRPRECADALSLQDHAFLYILSNVEQYPPELLGHLPLSLRRKLLSTLPPFRLFQLEATPIARGIDTDEMWGRLSRQQDCVWAGYLRGDEEEEEVVGRGEQNSRRKQSTGSDSDASTTTRSDSAPRTRFVNYLSHLLFNEMNRDYACKRITELLHAIHVDSLDRSVGDALACGHVTSLFMFQPPYHLLPFRCRNLTERELYWLLQGNGMLPSSLELYTYNVEYSPLWNQELVSQSMMRRLLSRVSFLRVYNHMNKNFPLQEVMDAVVNSSHYRDPPSSLGRLRHLELLRADERHLSTVVPYLSGPGGYASLTSLSLSMRHVDYVHSVRHVTPILRHQLGSLQHLTLCGFSCSPLPHSCDELVSASDYMFFNNLADFVLSRSFRSLTIEELLRVPWVLLKMLLEASLRTVPAHRHALTFKRVSVTLDGELFADWEDEYEVEGERGAEHRENQFYPASETACLQHKQLRFQSCTLPVKVLEWLCAVERVYLNTLEFSGVTVDMSGMGSSEESSWGGIGFVTGRNGVVYGYHGRPSRLTQQQRWQQQQQQQQRDHTHNSLHHHEAQEETQEDLKQRLLQHKQLECRLFLWEQVKTDRNITDRKSVV